MTLKLGLPGGMADPVLCQLLLERGSLTDMQMADVVAAAARVSAGGRLDKKERDRLMAIAMAQKLTERTQIKKRATQSAVNIGDPYSAYRTSGTAEAEKVLAKGRTPSGKMLVPPTRRVG